jgi:hypothetical protein
MLAARGLKPMSWLSSPKVRLALIVNGLYFMSLFTPTARHGRPDFFVRARATHAGRSVPAVQPDPALFPPPSGPSRTSAFESGGHLHVSLNDDLTLVNRPGHKLVLSPSFNASAYPPAEPKSVILNFILYSDSDAKTRPGDCPLIIKADAEMLWPNRAAIDPRADLNTCKRESVPRSSSKLEDGRVVETTAAESFSAEIPYSTFLDIISAKHVVVRLGPDWVELNTEQMEALRDMHRRLPQPPPPDDSDSY